MTVFNRHFAADAATPALKRRAATASLAVAGVLVAAKGAVYFFSGSVSLLSSVMDSAFDALASALILLSVTRAAVPADRDHRYGHGKIEALGALAQGIFILGPALFLMAEAVRRFFDPQPVEHAAAVLGVMGLSIAMTAGLLAYQRRVIAATGSVAIRADSLHYAGDLWMNIAVIAAVALGSLTGWPHFDPLFALALALRLAYGAWEVGRQSFDILLDRELPDAARQRIKEIVRAHDGVRGLHDLRTRAAGDRVFIEFHIEVDRDLSIAAVHDIMDALEEKIFEAFPRSEVLMHPEPEGLHDFRLDRTLV